MNPTAITQSAMVAIPHFLSPQEYLSLEQHSDLRHEYRQGLMYAMAGGSDNHDRLALNLLSLINLHLGGSNCRFYSGNVKVNYGDDFSYYPDAFVTCDPRDRRDRYLKRYPKLIVEVLSPSTQVFDLGQKFEDYCQISTLEEYVLISQAEQRLECRRRSQGGTWETAVYQQGDRVSLVSIGLEFALTDLYQGLD